LLFERDCGVAARILGDYDEAFGHYHVLVAGLERMGEQARLATVGAEYATEFFDRLGVAEARRLYDRALAVAADSDVSAQASVRSLKAMLLSHDGDHANAVRTAREAIVWMDRTDQTAERARMRERLATVLVAAGEPAHALSALAGAAALFDDKGDIPEARRVRERTLQVGALPAKVPHG
jgi:tetratricopeptide (TPR) repeat protein